MRRVRWGTSRLLLLVPFLLLGGVLPLRGEVRLVPHNLLTTIADDEPYPPPRTLTSSHTVKNRVREVRGGEVRLTMPAEYEHSAGLLLRWGTFNAALTQIVVGATTAEPPVLCHLVVFGRAQRERAAGVLARAGADLDRVLFIDLPTDSPWIRDYGPRGLVSEEGARPALLDHAYNRDRPADDALPLLLGSLWNEPRYQLPLHHAGGNLQVFADGDAFATDLLFAENPELPAWRLHEYFLVLAHLRLNVYPAFPRSFDATGHIDMWMLPVRDREVIIGRYAARTGAPHEITERAASDLLARGYLVHRTPGWRSGQGHYSFTNALILNDLVFVPTYEDYPRRSRQALESFRRIFPDKQTIPVESTRLVNHGGALHCIALQLPR